MGFLKESFKNRSGMYRCSACNGRGYSVEGRTYPVCKKCQGTGKLDWLERVVGKKTPDPNQIVFSNYEISYIPSKLMVLKFDIQKLSFKKVLLYLRAFDIFIDFGRFSIPFMRTIVLLNILVWIILFFGVK